MSLAGRGIVLTRPRGLAERLARALEARGARAILFPTIEIELLAPPASLARLTEYDLVVFVSPSAVQAALHARPPWPPRRAAAIGPGTRRELEQAGASSVVAPTARADSEALLALPELAHMAGQRVLIVRGDEGRALLGDMLAARGARVEYAHCYRRVRPRADASALAAAAGSGGIDAIVVGSAQALDNFVAMGGGGWLATTPLFVPHERIERHARACGAREVVLAGALDDQLIERLVAYFDGRN
jgi:uroporphyrinogen-III synthase